MKQSIKVGNLTFDTDIRHKDNLFDIPRSRTDRANKLKMFIHNECLGKWNKEPKDLVTLKKRYINELIDAI